MWSEELKDDRIKSSGKCGQQLGNNIIRARECVVCRSYREVIHRTENMAVTREERRHDYGSGNRENFEAEAIIAKWKYCDGKETGNLGRKN